MPSLTCKPKPCCGLPPRPSSAFSGNWKFANTAKSARRQSITWRYKGYHAWFQVSVAIEQFVIRNGVEIADKTLRSAGPVNCCAAPSGGFDYTGKE